MRQNGEKNEDPGAVTEISTGAATSRDEAGSSSSEGADPFEQEPSSAFGEQSAFR
jgi:hypothetical protein